MRTQSTSRPRVANPETTAATQIIGTLKRGGSSATGTGTGKRKAGRLKRPYRDDGSAPLPRKRLCTGDLSPESKHRLLADYKVVKALRAAGVKA